MRPLTAPRLRPHILFAILCLASIALFSAPLRQLVALSLEDRRYSHLILIPVISAFVLYLDRGRIFSRTSFRPQSASPFLAAALALAGLLAFRIVPVPAHFALSLTVLAIVLVWFAAFAVAYGAQSWRAATFPLLFLLLIVPVPFAWMDRVITLLQHGSAEATFQLFSLIGVPMFRDGVSFELPGVGIVVAEECSSIHSAWALFITGLLVAHLFLKSGRTKLALSLLTVPIAMFTNAIRIVTIWFLGTKVNPGYFYGDLHRNGGILFSLISLSILMTCLYLLRKTEHRRLSLVPAD